MNVYQSMTFSTQNAIQLLMGIIQSLDDRDCSLYKHRQLLQHGVQHTHIFSKVNLFKGYMKQAQRLYYGNRYNTYYPEGILSNFLVKLKY